MDVLSPATSAACSDDALVARLYELGDNDDSGELARVDALVYERLLQTYGNDGEATAG
ncbi:hypothetical protein ACW7G0_06810 [Lysobacter sp. A286]